MTGGNDMVWDGGSDPLVVPTRWALLGVSPDGVPVWLCSAGLVFRERRVGRLIRVTYERGNYFMFAV